MTPNAILLNEPARANAAAAAAPAAAYAAETLAGGVELIDRLAAEWDALCAEGAPAEAFSRPAWFRAFVANFEDEILLVTVRRGGRLRAVLPLARRRTTLHGLPATVLGAVFNLQSQRFDLVHGADESEKEPVIAALWEAIRAVPGWSVFETRLTGRESWLGALLARAAREGCRTGVWEMDAAPFVALPDGADKPRLIEDYFKGLSKNRRKLLGKNLRHLEERGRVEFVVTRGCSPELLERYFALEAGGWKARAGTDVNSDPRIARLHADFARACADRGALIVHELKLDGETIAMYLSLAFDARRTLGWKMSFDERFARFSPGNVLFKEVLGDCLRRGATELDMLSPATYNKNLFASGARPHAAFYIFRRSAAGALLAFWKFSVAARLRDRRARKRRAAGVDKGPQN